MRISYGAWAFLKSKVVAGSEGAFWESASTEPRVPGGLFGDGSGDGKV